MLGVAVVVLAVLAGCEEEIALVDNPDGAFTLYGVLNPKADTQYVHVFPIEGTLRPLPPEPLGATFTSEELETGAVRTWHDSLVVEADGGTGHVYWSAFRPAFERTYRVAVAAEDGPASTATVEVPPDTRARVAEPVVRGADVTLPVFLDGDIPNLVGLELRMRVRVSTGGVMPVELYNRDLVVETFEVAPTTGGGRAVEVDFDAAYRATRAQAERTLDASEIDRYGFQLLLITLELIVANEAWDPPGGTFDPRTLAYPTVLTNVENGLGFVGAGYEIRQQWRPPFDIVERVGFVGPR